MKRLDKIEYRGLKGFIIYEHRNGLVDISIYKPQVIYQNINRRHLKILNTSEKTDGTEVNKC